LGCHKIYEVTISFAMSCLSACNNWASTGWIFVKPDFKVC